VNLRFNFVCRYLIAGLFFASAATTGQAFIQNGTEGAYDYFFSGANSLYISSGGDVDLSRLSYIRLSNSGINVGVPFEILPGVSDLEGLSSGGVSWLAAATSNPVLRITSEGSVSLMGTVSGFQSYFLFGGNTGVLGTLSARDLLLTVRPGTGGVLIANAGGSIDLRSNTVALSAIPEPSSLILLLTGLFGVLWVRRLRHA
jgi:PEP-CTERM motif